MHALLSVPFAGVAFAGTEMVPQLFHIHMQLLSFGPDNRPVKSGEPEEQNDCSYFWFCVLIFKG